jgi:type IV pilus assembly protein PilC
MSSYSYVAVDPRGIETRGMLEVSDQNEAVRRVKEMGLFPTRILQERRAARTSALAPSKPRATALGKLIHRGIGTGVSKGALMVFTRQLATLIEAGMPLLRSLRTLQQQCESRGLKAVLEEVSLSIENGSSLAEALQQHPRVFNRLYVNMVRAGEVSGALETTLQRLSGFIEKSHKLRGKIKAALFYPAAVISIAGGILVILMTYVVPRFQAIFTDLMNGAPLPPFTRFVFGVSDLMRQHLWTGLSVLAAQIILCLLAARTKPGRWLLDRVTLSLPLVGGLFRKVAISRLSRTLGTLVGSGVPILQALIIVKETAGNLLFANAVQNMHGKVKEGDPLAPSFKQSGLFPAMVGGMVDVGEQTGALPEMLDKIAEVYDEEVDNATSALTSLLEPVMIVFLAVIVGSIVVAMFLPLIHISTFGFEPPGNAPD